MTNKIHQTAIIGDKVKLGNNIEIGAYTIIDGDVTIGDNTKISSHIIVKGKTTIGKNNQIYQFASIGEDCQDLKYKGEETTLEIGDNNIIRESVTMHRGTAQDKGITKIGNNNLFMVNVHVAHDCIIGNGCIFANNATLAGHVTIENNVIFGGQSAIHQFGKVGSHAFIGGCAAVNKDVPPYVMVVGNYAYPVNINTEGLIRRGFTNEVVKALRKAYKITYRSKLTINEAVDKMQDLANQYQEVKEFINFLQNNPRGIVR